MSIKSPSLIVYHNQEIVFQSDEKWLYPLFSLEDFLDNHPINMSQVLIHDKVIGKAAAMLITRFGPGRVHGVVMSKLAMAFFEQVGIPYTFDQAVKRIQCKTETILHDIDDIEQAYQILCQRVKRQ